jgi:CBS domain-containing protein
MSTGRPGSRQLVSSQNTEAWLVRLHKRTPQLTFIAAAVFFLGLGLFAAWGAKQIGIGSNAVYVSLVLVPVLIYAIVSGRLTELTGPGGLGAKFAGIARQSASSTTVDTIRADAAESVDDVLTVGGRVKDETLQQKLPIAETQPTVLKIVMRKRKPGKGYARHRVLELMGRLSDVSKNFEFVVFVDDDDRVLGYMPIVSFARMLSDDVLSEAFLQAVNDNRLSTVFDYPGVLRATLSPDTSNAEALRQMVERNTNALVAVDNDGKLKGIIERNQLVTRVLAALVE